jgi:hypothetical protein
MSRILPTEAGVHGSLVSVANTRIDDHPRRATEQRQAKEATVPQVDGDHERGGER